MLTEFQRSALLEIARQAVESAVQGSAFQIPEPPDPTLARLGAAFVTLKCRGRLRGCIGFVEERFPLYRSVAQAALAAATEDYRFHPVSRHELPSLEMEISVLSPLERVQEASEIKVGEHGLVVEQGLNRGLLLPQVPAEFGWDREEFLAHTCLKAGLSPDAWKQDAVIYRFSAEVFGHSPPPSGRRR